SSQRQFGGCYPAAGAIRGGRHHQTFRHPRNCSGHSLGSKIPIEVDTPLSRSICTNRILFATEEGLSRWFGNCQNPGLWKSLQDEPDDPEVPNLLGAAPKMIRPPEDVLHKLCHGNIGSTWSEAADIWAVGCTSLFRHGVLQEIFFSGQFNSVDLPQKRGRKFGSRKIGNMTMVAPTLYDRDKVWGVQRIRNEEALKFIHLLKRMIITKPDERTPMTVLLTDPFMVERRKPVKTSEEVLE
ncbi:hypothetical protein E4U50_008344, partial [Claviceps purpurea]